MDKNLIKNLYSRGDPKRKKILYEAFQAIFHSSFSYDLIVVSINEELGERIIDKNEVRYIKTHFVRKQRKAKESGIKEKRVENPKERPAFNHDILGEIAQQSTELNQQKSQRANQDFLNTFINTSKNERKD